MLATVKIICILEIIGCVKREKYTQIINARAVILLMLRISIEITVQKNVLEGLR